MQWLREKQAIRRHLRELKEQMETANTMEAKYVDVALRRGEEIFASIKTIHGDVKRQEPLLARAKAKHQLDIMEGSEVDMGDVLSDPKTD